jgi:putative hydrolase of HD superfamily
VTGLPAEVGRAVRDLVGEYEARETTEARLAKEADKLECLLQARESQAQGHGDVAAWIESSAAGLRSASARRLADACRRVPPRRWWEAVAGARARSGQPRSQQVRPDGRGP